MTQAELLRYLVDVLDSPATDYMIVGLHASIYYGEPRFTQDVDVVIEGPEIDIVYVTDWAGRLGVEDVWDAVRRRARHS